MIKEGLGYNRFHIKITNKFILIHVVGSIYMI